MTESKNVVTALAAVIAEMPAIGKDAQASSAQGGYSYRGIESITAAIQPLLAKHGVVFAPEVVDWTEKDITVNGKPWTDQRLKVRYTIYGPGGPEDKIETTVVGIGRDNSDKGSNKALTQAFKYLLLQTFCIADPKDDGDKESHEAETPAPAPERTWVDNAAEFFGEDKLVAAAEKVRAEMGRGKPIKTLWGVRTVQEGTEPYQRIMAALQEDEGAASQEAPAPTGDEATAVDSPAPPSLDDPHIKARVLEERRRHKVKGNDIPVTCLSKVTFSGACPECDWNPSDEVATLPPVQEVLA